MAGRRHDWVRWTAAAIVRSGPAASAEDLEQATIRLLEVLRPAA